MANTLFPLLRLPETAMHHVLKHMDHIELISYSLLSRKATSLIQSLEIKASKISVVIWPFCVMLQIRFQNSEVVEISMFEIENPNFEALKLNVDIPCNEISISTPLFHQPPKWNIQPLNLKGWLDHLSSIFNYCKPPNLDFESAQEVFDTESIRRVVPEISSLLVCNDPEYAIKVLRLFLSDATCKDLCFQCDPFKNEPSVVLQRVGIQNLDDVDFYWLSKIALDDLLMFNFHYIHIGQRFLMSVKNTNRFIKNWIKGSNPKLKWIRILFTGTLKEGTVLKGIPFKVVPKTTERTIDANNSRMSSIIKGGFDVRNKRGITANIQMKNYEGFGKSIELYVIN